MEKKSASKPETANPSGSKAEYKRFFKFLITSGFAALVNIGARVVLSQFVNFHFAIILAYLIAMITAYVLSRSFVFEESGHSVTEELIKFAIVNIIALAQVWLVTVVMNYQVLPALDWTYHPKLVAHFVGVASPVFTSYFGHKYFSFSHRPPNPPA